MQYNISKSTDSTQFPQDRENTCIRMKSNLYSSTCNTTRKEIRSFKDVPDGPRKELQKTYTTVKRIEQMLLAKKG